MTKEQVALGKLDTLQFTALDEHQLEEIDGGHPLAAVAVVGAWCVGVYVAGYAFGYFNNKK